MGEFARLVDARKGADGLPIGGGCAGECVSPVGNQSHRPVCHSTFSTSGNFDRHRRGGRCLTPGSLGFHRTERGTWKQTGDARMAARVQGFATDGRNHAPGASTPPGGDSRAQILIPDGPGVRA